MTVLAIDPGLSGAAALVGPGVLAVRRDFKHWEDIPQAIAELQRGADVAVMELVHSMPGEGVASMFNFGSAAGVALGALATHGFTLHQAMRRPLIEVAPLRWQNYFWTLLGTPEDKRKDFDSRAVLRRFLPAADEFLVRVKDHNSADALCMAVWYQCNLDAKTSPRERDRKMVRRAARLTRRAALAK